MLTNRIRSWKSNFQYIPVVDRRKLDDRLASDYRHLLIVNIPRN
jgi:hypothetical protein